MLRNNSDMPKTLKNKMVSGNPRPYSTSKLSNIEIKGFCCIIKLFMKWTVRIFWSMEIIVNKLS